MNMRINGVEISEAAIFAEMQYHPAATVVEAQRLASEALAVREILAQEAASRGFGEGADAIDALLAAAVPLTMPSDAACQSFYESQADRFRSNDLIEGEHILIAADPEDEEARVQARLKAEGLLAQIQADPSRFADLAREHSDCPSKANGGNLGQITRGATVPEFETYLFSLEEGEFCPVAVPSRYGFHIARLRHRAKGRTLPFEHVREQIADYLSEQAWRQEVSRFIADLAAAARLEGVELVSSYRPMSERASRHEPTISRSSGSSMSP
jgi:peptidyl-prolyl cis-trans isomerase C